MGLVVDSYRFAAAAPSFDPETDITWHSLFWAEGTDFVAQGYTNGNAVGTWPNETSEKDATEATNKPTLTATNASFNDKPTVDFSANTAHKLVTDNFTSNPVYPISVVVVGSIRDLNNAVIVDGNDASNRNTIQRGDPNTRWQIFSGNSVFTTGADANPHLFVASFKGAAGNSTLSVDGTQVINGSSGSGKIDGVTLGNYPLGGFSGGNLALCAIYSGDITQDGEWANFKTWVEDHYDITIA
jgi:hypothetical protein